MSKRHPWTVVLAGYSPCALASLPAPPGRHSGNPGTRSSLAAKRQLFCRRWLAIQPLPFASSEAKVRWWFNPIRDRIEAVTLALILLCYLSRQVFMVNTGNQCKTAVYQRTQFESSLLMTAFITSDRYLLTYSKAITISTRLNR